MMVTWFFHLLKSLLLQGTDLVIPNICVHCNSRIRQPESFLCFECRSRQIFIPKATCEKCGYYFEFTNKDITLKSCPHCCDEDFVFDKGCAAVPYDKITQELIHNFKYGEMTKISNKLVELLAVWVDKHKPFAKIDVVVPVPLHHVRERERGYNQSALLASALASHFQWPYRSDLIKRTKYTKSQTSLKGEERKGNVDKAFSVDKNTGLKDYDILVVDDVFTTGATVNAISKELKSKGAASVYVLTVARAGLTLNQSMETKINYNVDDIRTG